LIETNILMENG